MNQTEAEFLNEYDANKYPTPLLSVDSVLFTIADEQLKILLVKRAEHPFKNDWALPGGFVDIETDDTTNTTANRKIIEKTQVFPPYLEQLQTFSSKHRDPRGWSASVAYFALISHEETRPHIEHDDTVQWVGLEDLSTTESSYTPIAFDHAEIIGIALHRLRQKALYSMIPIFCLPEEFTLGEYHKVMEIILNKSIQKKTLYRRFEASEMFEETGKTVATGARAAMLYRLKDTVQLINFERNLG